MDTGGVRLGSPYSIVLPQLEGDLRAAVDIARPAVAGRPRWRVVIIDSWCRRRAIAIDGDYGVSVLASSLVVVRHGGGEGAGLDVAGIGRRRARSVHEQGEQLPRRTASVARHGGARARGTPHAHDDAQVADDEADAATLEDADEAGARQRRRRRRLRRTILTERRSRALDPVAGAIAS